MAETCIYIYIPSLIVINTTINQSETNIIISNSNLLPEVICRCLKTCNVLVAEVIMGDTCIPSLIIDTTVNQF